MIVPPKAADGSRTPLIKSKLHAVSCAAFCAVAVFGLARSRASARSTAGEDLAHDLTRALTVVLAGVSFLEARHQRAHRGRAVGDPAPHQVHELGVVEWLRLIPRQHRALGGVLLDQLRAA